jgi:hypothetical protein
VSAAHGASDRRAGAGAEQAATDRALCRIIRVCATRQSQYQGRGNRACGNRTLGHLTPSPNYNAEPAGTFADKLSMFR